MAYFPLNRARGFPLILTFVYLTHTYGRSCDSQAVRDNIVTLTVRRRRSVRRNLQQQSVRPIIDGRVIDATVQAEEGEVLYCSNCEREEGDTCYRGYCQWRVMNYELDSAGSIPGKALVTFLSPGSVASNPFIIVWSFFTALRSLHASTVTEYFSVAVPF
jgi:hypothetical protein